MANRILIAGAFAVTGAFVGGCIGIPIGEIIVEVAQVSNFEGGRGYAVLAIINTGAVFFALIFGLYGLFVWTTTRKPNKKDEPR
ncbi:MAG: hypothetical protein U0930_26455 [Pirellulales bacterium]